jgi:hypothetical protein
MSTSSSGRKIDRLVFCCFDTELLDMILHYAGPKAQVQALYVSTAWRSSALFTIGSAINPFGFRSLDIHAPVEYGQSLEQTSAAPQLSPGELDDSVSKFNILMLRRDSTRDRRYFYFSTAIAVVKESGR